MGGGETDLGVLISFFFFSFFFFSFFFFSFFFCF